MQLQDAKIQLLNKIATVIKKLCITSQQENLLPAYLFHPDTCTWSEFLITITSNNYCTVNLEPKFSIKRSGQQKNFYSTLLHINKQILLLLPTISGSPEIFGATIAELPNLISFTVLYSLNPHPNLGSSPKEFLAPKFAPRTKISSKSCPGMPPRDRGDSPATASSF
jgi:hypothetical protein